MSEYLGNTFRSGDPAPETGTYQLLGENSSPDERIQLGRVVRIEKGTSLPFHPDTGGVAEWRYVRIDQYARKPEMLLDRPPAPH